MDSSLATGNATGNVNRSEQEPDVVPPVAPTSGASAQRESGPAADAGSAAPIDAGKLATAVLDAATAARAERPADAGMPRDAALPTDASRARDAAAPHDAAAPAHDAAPADAAAPDAAVSGNQACAAMVTLNRYEGEPNYHGMLGLENVGKTTWSLPVISFDLLSTNYVCNDASDLPGAGWVLQSSAGHCEYRKTAPALSIAPNALLSFEYSSNLRDTLTEAAVVNVSVTACD